MIDVTTLGSGKRSYVTAGLLVILGIGTALGYVEIPDDVREGLVTLLAGAGLAFLRSGVTKEAR